MKRKVLSIFLAVVMTVGMLAGCSKKTETSDTTVTDTPSNDSATEAPDTVTPFKVSMLYCENANAPFSQDWLILKLIEKYTGAQLEVQSVPSSDYETKRQIIFNSGDIPDIVGQTFAKSTDALSGLLLPISDYEDQMPNLKKYIEDNGLQILMDNNRMSDGKYYTLPVKAKSEVIQDHQWLIRKDILDKNNLAMPTTMQELYDVAVKLKKIYPDSTPIGNRFGSANIMAGIASAYGTIAGWTLGNGMYYDRPNDTWEFAPTTDKWKQMLEMTRSLYADGALDPEFSTLDATVYQQNVNQGKIFITYDWAANCKEFNQDGKASDPDFNMVPMVPPQGLDGHYALQWNNAWEQGWVLPSTVADKKYFPQLLKFIDWCYSDEAATVLTFGEEGTTYKTEADGSHLWLDNTTNYSADYGLFDNNFDTRIDMDFYYKNLSPEVVDVYKKCNELKAVPIPNPNSPLDSAQEEQTSVISSTLKDYSNSMMESFIFGTESLDNWDKFVSECKAKGSEKLENTYNESSKK